MPDVLPEPHATFLESALERLAGDPRFAGVGGGGSLLTGGVDEFSDLDLVIAVEPAFYEEVLGSMEEIAAELGPAVSAFRGDHVGEPRLLICLYGPPLLHVDLKFVSLEDFGDRVEDPVVLWERDGKLGEALGRGVAAYPQPDLQWIEERFWTWVHYTAARIGRGELFEAIDSLAFLRRQVLGPLILRLHGARPTGVRRIERVAPGLADRLRRTVAAHDAGSCFDALAAAAALYRELRERLAEDGFQPRPAAEAAAMDYLAGVRDRGSLGEVASGA